MFSGYLSINEFRNSFIFQNKIFKVLDPPIISLIPKIEELIVHNNADNKLYIPIDKNILELAPDKTNFQYVSDLANHKYQNDFAALTLNYEYVWYGGFEIEQYRYQKIENQFINLNQKLLNQH